MAINTLTYANKVTLNQNSDVADINKGRAADWNEVKTVVNANANLMGDLSNLTTKTTTDLVSAMNGLVLTKLWENSNPTSSMNNGTSIPLSKSLSNFDFYFIIYREMTTYAQHYNTGFIPSTLGTRLICVNQNYMNFRTVNNNTTSLSVGSNFYLTGSGNAGENAVGNIPYQVYGGNFS